MRRPRSPEGLQCQQLLASSALGELCPQIWDHFPSSMGAAAEPPSLVPWRATKEKGADLGQAWADPFLEEKQHGAQPRAYAHGCAHSMREFVPGGCRDGTTKALKPHTIILYLREFGSQASRLSPGSPGHTCLLSSAPFLPCKAKNRI